MSYRLSAAARDDIIALYLQGVRLFGEPVAEDYHFGLEAAFNFLAEFPRAARERLEIEPPVRVHPYRSHIIIYVIAEPGILVLRVRHGREDWNPEP